MARRRKQLDLRAVAAALSDPAFEHASMAEVAARLGVAKPTLYRMAGSREELIAISIDAEAERLLEHVQRNGLAGVLHFARESPAGFVLLFGDRYPQARPAVRRVENRLARESSEPVAAGLLGFMVGVVRRRMEDDAAVDAEPLGSDFDAMAKLAAQISDAAA
jgi:AcrR family transcriptional regulator